MSNEIKPIKYCEEAIKIKRNLEAGFLTLAEMLYYIKKDELYNGKWESFASYLAEMDVKESQASKYISVYKSWILEAGVSPLKLQEIGVDKAYTALPLLKEGKDQAVKKASTLKREELRDEIYESRNGQTCEHKNLTKGYARCNDCGRFFKVE